MPICYDVAFNIVIHQGFIYAMIYNPVASMYGQFSLP